MIDLVRPVARSTESFLPKTRSAIDDLLRLEAKFPNFHGKVYPTREDAHERLLDGIAELGRATNGGEDSNHGITEKGVQIIMQRGIQKSECGTGWVFSRDLRHRVGSLYGLYNHNLEQVATNIHCKHLLIKASLSPNYEEDESISRTIACYSKNPLFVNSL
ncbi:uncharacterized protein LOC111714484 isoform X2 [Eurytemora carolleeae]|uniref:uncharacterized protein LOC111714484 isoform X2 n=1 Tax=Eurytemora carolleeae TaxID=1294199 RepID=UPI000C769E5F|nr:uncharacterized protein LOC111714484 isoform X2 [Eurytemora carolleeae]|eukprot:XP_023345374.1 uncharacterized protein LOC111714484 isoform X2 [Eurytemora affinis]